MSAQIIESVFEIAAREEVCENFLTRMALKHPKESADYKTAAAYIASDACLEDLIRLKSGGKIQPRLLIVITIIAFAQNGIAGGLLFCCYSFGF